MRKDESVVSIAAKTVLLCSSQRRRHVCSPLFRSQYTIHTDIRMEITTWGDRRFGNEFFMLAVDGDAIHTHTLHQRRRSLSIPCMCSNKTFFLCSQSLLISSQKRKPTRCTNGSNGIRSNLCSLYTYIGNGQATHRQSCIETRFLCFEHNYCVRAALRRNAHFSILWTKFYIGIHAFQTRECFYAIGYKVLTLKSTTFDEFLLKRYTKRRHANKKKRLDLSMTLRAVQQLPSEW